MAGPVPKDHPWRQMAKNKESSEMKRAILFVSVAVVLAALTGCRTDCGQCACRGGCNGRAGGYGGADAMEGSPTAAVAYPYYTVHGPRDFLDKNPESLGP